MILRLLLIVSSIGMLSSSVANLKADVIDENQVMLVYDSKNKNGNKNGKKSIDALQRSLTSTNLKVRTLEQSKYRKGMLNTDYLGVITMINWPEVGIVNQEFINDRDKFQGTKLHIGDGLTRKEIEQLEIKVEKKYQQQLILETENDRELLPFNESIILVTDHSKEAKVVGTLSTQKKMDINYPFGIINHNQGYLPFFETHDAIFLQSISLISKLFDRSGKFKPLLTFSELTPYSNLSLLDDLSKFCYQNEIPFAISVVSIDKNTEMKAFDRFAAALRNVERRGGIIFLKTPEVSTAGDKNGKILEQTFFSYIVSLARHQVFPVGISSDGFWNQDKVLRNNSLIYADHWLMLPNGKTTTYVNQDDISDISKQSFLGIPIDSLKNINKNSSVNFDVPTALTIAFPT